MQDSPTNSDESDGASCAVESGTTGRRLRAADQNLLDFSDTIAAVGAAAVAPSLNDQGSKVPWSAYHEEILQLDDVVILCMGVAGCGKTELLGRKAKKALASGKRILIMTQVSSVRDEVADRCSNELNRIVFQSDRDGGHKVAVDCDQTPDFSRGGVLQISTIDAAVHQMLVHWDFKFAKGNGADFTAKVKRMIDLLNGKLNYSTEPLPEACTPSMSHPFGVVPVLMRGVEVDLMMIDELQDAAPLHAELLVALMRKGMLRNGGIPAHLRSPTRVWPNGAYRSGTISSQSTPTRTASVPSPAQASAACLTPVRRSGGAAAAAGAVASPGGAKATPPVFQCIGVGDVLQSVFGHSVQQGLHMHAFNQVLAIPGCVKKQMPICYRCPHSHLDLVNLLCREAQLSQGLGPIQAARASGSGKRPILFTHEGTVSSGQGDKVAARVIALIRALLEQVADLVPGDICIVMSKVNENTLMQNLESSLEPLFRSHGFDPERGGRISLEFMEEDETSSSAAAAAAASHCGAGAGAGPSSGGRAATAQRPESKFVKYMATDGNNGRIAVNWASAKNKTAMTSVIAIKGRSSRVVFFLGLTEGAIPRKDSVYVPAELTCLSVLNVGLTRSTEYLFVGVNNSMPSRYILAKQKQLKDVALLSWDQTSWDGRPEEAAILSRYSSLVRRGKSENNPAPKWDAINDMTKYPRVALEGPPKLELTARKVAENDEVLLDGHPILEPRCWKASRIPGAVGVPWTQEVLDAKSDDLIATGLGRLGELLVDIELGSSAVTQLQIAMKSIVRAVKHPEERSASSDTFHVIFTDNSAALSQWTDLAVNFEVLSSVDSDWAWWPGIVQLILRDANGSGEGDDKKPATYAALIDVLKDQFGGKVSTQAEEMKIPLDKPMLMVVDALQRNVSGRLGYVEQQLARRARNSQTSESDALPLWTCAVISTLLTQGIMRNRVAQIVNQCPGGHRMWFPVLLRNAKATAAFMRDQHPLLYPPKPVDLNSHAGAPASASAGAASSASSTNVASNDVDGDPEGDPEDALEADDAGVIGDDDGDLDGVLGSLDHPRNKDMMCGLAIERMRYPDLPATAGIAFGTALSLMNANGSHDELITLAVGEGDGTEPEATEAAASETRKYGVAGVCDVYDTKTGVVTELKVSISAPSSFGPSNLASSAASAQSSSSSAALGLQASMPGVSSSSSSSQPRPAWALQAAIYAALQVLPLQRDKVHFEPSSLHIVDLGTGVQWHLDQDCIAPAEATGAGSSAAASSSSSSAAAHARQRQHAQWLAWDRNIQVSFENTRRSVLKVIPAAIDGPAAAADGAAAGGAPPPFQLTVDHLKPVSTPTDGLCGPGSSSAASSSLSSAVPITPNAFPTSVPDACTDMLARLLQNARFAESMLAALELPTPRDGHRPDMDGGSSASGIASGAAASRLDADATASAPVLAGSSASAAAASNRPGGFVCVDSR